MEKVSSLKSEFWLHLPWLFIVWLKVVTYPHQGSVSSSLKMMIMKHTSQYCQIKHSFSFVSRTCEWRQMPAEPDKSWNIEHFIQLNLFSLSSLEFRKHFVLFFRSQCNVQIKSDWSLTSVCALCGERPLGLGRVRGHSYLQKRWQLPGHINYCYILDAFCQDLCKILGF